MEGWREEQRWNGPVDRVTQQGTMPPPGPLAEHGDTDPCGWADIDTRELATARDTGPHHWAVPPHISERRGKHRHNGPDTWGKAVTGPTGLCRRTTTHISGRRGRHRRNGQEMWGKAVTGPTGLCRRTTTHISGRRGRHRHKGPDVGRRSSAGQHCDPCSFTGTAVLPTGPAVRSRGDDPASGRRSSPNFISISTQRLRGKGRGSSKVT